MRGLAHGKTEEVLPRSPRARRPDGARARPGARVAVGGDDVDRRQVRLYTGDQDERDRGQRGGLTTDERQRVKELEREVRELKRANEILQTASAYFAKAALDRRPK